MSETKLSKQEVLLRLLERGKETIITDKFANTLIELERDEALRAWKLLAIGQSLGELLGSVEYPRNWRRLLARKDCPKYMKEIVCQYVNAYYPKLSLPKEMHWVTFEQSVSRDDNG